MLYTGCSRILLALDRAGAVGRVEERPGSVPRTSNHTSTERARTLHVRQPVLVPLPVRQPVLVPLPGAHPHCAGLRRDVRQVKLHRFRTPDPRAVEDREERGVPHALRRGASPSRA